MTRFRVSVTRMGGQVLMMEQYEQRADAEVYFNNLTDSDNGFMDGLMSKYPEGVTIDFEELYQGTWVLITRRYGFQP